MQKVGFAPVARRSLSLFLISAVFLSGICFLVYYSREKIHRSALMKRETLKIAHQREIIENEIRRAVSDLMVLSAHNALHRMIDEGGETPRRALALEFQAFCNFKRTCHQARFLDARGMEVVRVNYRNGKARIVPVDQLQPKGKRYYFRETLRLGPGEIFVSPLDLNVEHGKIEEPPRPMIRFGTPVFDSRGQRKGAVVLNYLGSNILDHLERMDPNTSSQVMLLNSAGYWLKGPSAQDEWGFMYPGGKDRTFGHRFPKAWKKILKAPSGQFAQANGLFTFATVSPSLEGLKISMGSARAFAAGDGLAGSKEHYWKLVSRLAPPDPCSGLRKFMSRFFSMALGILILLAAGSGLIAYAQTGRKKAEARLRKSELQYRSLTQTAIDAIISVDGDGRIISWNQGAQAMFGYREEEVIGKPVTMIMPERYRDAHMRGMERMLETGRGRVIGKRLELHGLRSSGSEFPMSLSLSTWHADGETYFSGIVRDTTERKKMEARLEELAITDALTQCYNRGHFNAKLEEEYGRAVRYKTPLCLLMLDIDHFKALNDTHGHQAGDACLASLAGLLRSSVRSVDIVARYGGEEFVIIMPQTEAQNALIFAERLRRKVAELSIPFGDGSLRYTASIGVAALDPASPCPREEWLKAADTAMYAAKKAGRNRVVLSNGSD